MPLPDIRSQVLIAVDDGVIDKNYLIQSMLSWMTHEEIRQMLHANEIMLDPNADDNEEE